MHSHSNSNSNSARSGRSRRRSARPRMRARVPRPASSAAVPPPVESPCACALHVGWQRACKQASRFFPNPATEGPHPIFHLPDPDLAAIKSAPECCCGGFTRRIRRNLPHMNERLPEAGRRAWVRYTPPVGGWPHAGGAEGDRRSPIGHCRVPEARTVC